MAAVQASVVSIRSGVSGEASMAATGPGMMNTSHVVTKNGHQRESRSRGEVVGFGCSVSGVWAIPLAFIIPAIAGPARPRERHGELAHTDSFDGSSRLEI